jgi:hypothetical protein
VTEEPAARSHIFVFFRGHLRGAAGSGQPAGMVYLMVRPEKVAEPFGQTPTE